MIQAVIIDDEKNAIEILQLQLKKHCPQVSVVATFNKPLEALAPLATLQYQLLFLDIEMPYCNGFDFLNQLTIAPANIVFTTAYDKYAIKAFKFGAIDYLLKPIEVVELKNIVGKLENSIVLKPNMDHTQQTILALKQPHIKIPIATYDGISFFSINDIIQIESDGSYSKVYTTHQSAPILVSKSLAEFDSLLCDSCFFRIHNSHLINIEAVVRYLKADGGTVILKNNIQVPISRAKKNLFAKLMGI
jgi:two-component system LytT family response regulator